MFILILDQKLSQQIKTNNKICEIKIVVVKLRIGCWDVVRKIRYTIKITIRPTKGFAILSNLDQMIKTLNQIKINLK